MKKIQPALYGVFLLLAINCKAQLVVNDPVTTKLIAISNLYTNATSTYTKISAQMAEGTLSQVTRNAELATKNLDLLQKAVDVANIFMGSQVTLDFFYNQRRILDKVREVSKDMYSIPADLLRSNVRGLIVKHLDDGFILAAKSLQVAKNAFVQQQLNLTERLTHIEAANKYLDDAQRNINAAVAIISNSKLVANRLRSRTQTIKLLY